MSTQKTLKDYIKSPITEIERNKIVNREESDYRIYNKTALYLTFMLPFLKTFIDYFAIESKSFNIVIGQLSVTIFELLAVNIAAFVIALFTIKLFSMKKSMSKTYSVITSNIVVLMATFSISVYYLLTQKGLNDFLTMWFYSFMVTIIAGFILFISHQMVYDMYSKKFIVSYNNKDYKINIDSLVETNDINEIMIIDNESKMFYNNIKKLNRKPYRFERDLIVQMNVQQYEVELKGVLIQ